MVIDGWVVSEKYTIQSSIFVSCDTCYYYDCCDDIRKLIDNKICCEEYTGRYLDEFLWKCFLRAKLESSREKREKRRTKENHIYWEFRKNKVQK